MLVILIINVSFLFSMSFKVVCDMIEGERCVLEVSCLPIKGLHVESLKKCLVMFGN